MNRLIHALQIFPTLVAAVLVMNCVPYSKSRTNWRPPAPNKIVLKYEQYLGSEAGLYIKQTAPRMVIYGDGRVVVGDPRGYQKLQKPRANHVSMKTGRITRAELIALMRFILAENRFRGMSTKSIRAKIRTHHTIADATSTELRVGNGKTEHRVHVYALSWLKDSKVPEVRRMLAIQNRLEKLRARIITGD